MGAEDIGAMARSSRRGVKVNWDDREWKYIEGLCHIQCTAAEIAGVMGCSTETLSRKIKETHGIGFSEFYKQHSDGGKASLRRAQFRLAERNAGMAIWLGKQYLGQREPGIGDVQGGGEKPTDNLYNAIAEAVVNAAGDVVKSAAREENAKEKGKQ